MGVSKVVLGDETLIDLTSDSVSSENLLEGATAHGADGEEVIGGVVVTPMYTGTKAAIEAAIAAGQIPEDAIVNITDDEETSSFQSQINQINDSLTNITEAEVTCTVINSGIISVRKLSNIVFVYVNIQTNKSLSGATLFTLPENFRPLHQIQFLCSIATTSLCNMVVNTDGSVRLSGNNAQSIASNTWITSYGMYFAI
jgi:hypothetical protein